MSSGATEKFTDVFLIVLDNNGASWWSKKALASFDYRGNTSDHFMKIRRI